VLGEPRANEPSTSRIWLSHSLSAELVPVWELVLSIPAPCCGNRHGEDPTYAKVLIGRQIVLTDSVGRMSDVEVDRSAATRLAVYIGTGPFLGWSTLPGWGSPCGNCSGAPRSIIARLIECKAR
jgi:hypothetical protein